MTWNPPSRADSMSSLISIPIQVSTKFTYEPRMHSKQVTTKYTYSVIQIRVSSWFDVQNLWFFSNEIKMMKSLLQ